MRPRGDRKPTEDVEACVDVVSVWHAERLRTREIRALARHEWTREQTDAAKWKRLTPRQRQGKEVPACIWGTEPPSARTIDRYIALAKERLESDARQLAELGAQWLGLHLAQQDLVFREAFKRERYHVCMRVLEQRAAMFGFEGVAKIQLFSGDTPPESPDRRPEATMTEYSALWEMRDMLRRAMARRNGKETGHAMPTEAR